MSKLTRVSIALAAVGLTVVLVGALLGSEVLHEYLHIMSDPAHLAAEVSLMLIIDGLFLGLIWPLVKNRMHKVVDARVAAEHRVIDAEHGVVHAPDGSVPYRAPSLAEAWVEGAGEAAPPRAAFDPADDPGGYR